MFKLIVVVVLILLATVVYGLIKRTQKLSRLAEQQTKAADKSKLRDLDHDAWAREQQRQEAEAAEWQEIDDKNPNKSDHSK